jgi:hypothetical protein
VQALGERDHEWLIVIARDAKLEQRLGEHRAVIVHDGSERKRNAAGKQAPYRTEMAASDGAPLI